jgi:hypothetical protein
VLICVRTLSRVCPVCVCVCVCVPKASAKPLTRPPLARSFATIPPQASSSAAERVASEAYINVHIYAYKLSLTHTRIHSHARTHARTHTHTRTRAHARARTHTNTFGRGPRLRPGMRASAGRHWPAVGMLVPSNVLCKTPTRASSLSLAPAAGCQLRGRPSADRPKRGSEGGRRGPWDFRAPDGGEKVRYATAPGDAAAEHSLASKACIPSCTPSAASSVLSRSSADNASSR